jgi:hypothetical protein
MTTEEWKGKRNTINSYGKEDKKKRRINLQQQQQ